MYNKTNISTTQERNLFKGFFKYVVENLFYFHLKNLGNLEDVKQKFGSVLMHKRDLDSDRDDM